MIGSDNGLSPLSEPMLDYCQLALLKKTPYNLIKNTTIFIQEIAIENVVCELAAILFRLQRVHYVYDTIFTMMPTYVMDNSLKLILNPKTCLQLMPSHFI